MTKLLSVQLVAKILLVVGCVALVNRKSDAFLLGNIIGCNSFGCRLTNLENEVNHLKNQVNRMQMNSPTQGFNNGNNNNNANPNQGYNGLNNNNQMNGSQLPQQQQQQQQGTANNGQQQQNVRQLGSLNTSQMFPNGNELSRVNYGNVDYNQAQATRRVNNGGMFDGAAAANQFFRA